MHKIKPNKKITTKKLAIFAGVSVLIFSAVVTLMFFVLFWRKNETYGFVFPDYVGSYDSSALQKNGMTVNRNYVNSEIYPEGVVISQYPEGLSEKRIKKGQSPVLTLNISAGREKFVLPELSEKTPNQALIILRGMQCEARIVKIYGDFSEKKVSSSFPQAGSTVRVGDRVTLYVETPKVKSVKEIPSVIGLDERSAVRELTAQGFDVEVEDGFDMFAMSGEVISQYPMANTYAAQNTVKITVNSD
ncbi:MAG: PASTA domain-containing protein [Ruminococcaceae bacterium]|nr:PASTA domain-containing protein [Oscillospiraceae bacterium]